MVIIEEVDRSRGRPVDPVARLGDGPFRWVYESVMVALALVVVALLLRDDMAWTSTVNLAVWAVFVTDYVVRLALSGDRRAFVGRNVVDLVAIVPLDFLRAARVLRLARLLRLVRAGAVLWRVSAVVRGVLRTNGLAWVLAVAGGLVAAGGLAIRVVEPSIGALGDALWWSLVTTTTVGYGDLSPESFAGRVIAGVLMVVGIGTIGMITGTIATYFIDDRSGQHAGPHIGHIREQLLRWHDMTAAERQEIVAMLGGLASATTSPHTENVDGDASVNP